MTSSGGRSGISLIEIKIVVGIVVVLTAAGVPLFLRMQREMIRKQPEFLCLAALASAAEGQADARCPAVGKPVAVRGSPGGTTVTCPDPANHLSPTLAFRRLGSVLSLQQTLPPPPSLDRNSFEATGFWVELETRGTTLRARMKNGFGYRWILAPLLAGFFLYWAGVIAWIWFERRKEGAAAVTYILLCVAAALGLFGLNHRTTEVEIDGTQRRMTRNVTAWGIPVWPTEVHERLIGVAALKGKRTSWLTAVVRGPERFDLVNIVPIPEASLGAAARFQEVFDAGR